MSASALKGRRIPAQGATLGIQPWVSNPGYPTLDIRGDRSGVLPRYSRNAATGGIGQTPSIQEYAAFLQNAGDGVDGTQGVALGWYAVSRWDTRSRSHSPDHSHLSAHFMESTQAIQGTSP